MNARAVASASRRCSPLETVSPSEHRQKSPRPGTAECPRCGKQFCSSAVVIDAPSFSIELQRWTTHARLFCDHCGHLVVFLAGWDPEKCRLTERLGEPGFVTDPRAVRNFLTDFPEAAGVLQH